MARTYSEPIPIDPELLKISQHSEHAIPKTDNIMSISNLCTSTTENVEMDVKNQFPDQNNQIYTQALYPPRFKIGQEVHIVDTAQCEPSGLTTYIVITNHEFLPTTGEPIYRLQPCNDTTFRTTESRLLEAGYPLGTEVKQMGNVSPAIVIRRFVKDGERMYDLKDMFGLINTGVLEQDIGLHSGGEFDFVCKY